MNEKLLWIIMGILAVIIAFVIALTPSCEDEGKVSQYAGDTLVPMFDSKGNLQGFNHIPQYICVNPQ